MLIKRNETRQVKVKNIIIGGSNNIFIQSMTTTKTKDVNETIKQINNLEKIGCDLIRVSVFDIDDANALKDIMPNIKIPLIADIHYNFEFAKIAIKSGVAKIRINPANMQDIEKLKEIGILAKEYNCAIRVGLNDGSFKEKTKISDIMNLAKLNIDALNSIGFFNIVLSFKSSEVEKTYKLYEEASKIFNYPLHVGITESGTLIKGIVKSTLGISKILELGIGNTIRVSLTDDPMYEIKVAKEILSNLNLLNKNPKLISCPTCGRCMYNMMPIAKKIDDYLYTIKKDIKVAIMGCSVNGPGEAKDADIGIAGGTNEALFFKKGKIIKKIKQEEVYDFLIDEINKF